MDSVAFWGAIWFCAMRAGVFVVYCAVYEHTGAPNLLLGGVSQLLVTEGKADVEAKDRRRWTPLMCAANGGRRDCLQVRCVVFWIV